MHRTLLIGLALGAAGCAAPAPQGNYGPETLDARYDLGSTATFMGVMALGDVDGQRGAELLVVPNAGEDAVKGNVVVMDGAVTGTVGRREAVAEIQFTPFWSAWSMATVGVSGNESLVVGLNSSQARALPLPIESDLDLTDPDEEAWVRPPIPGGPFADRLLPVPGEDLVWVSASEETVVGRDSEDEGFVISNGALLLSVGPGGLSDPAAPRATIEHPEEWFTNVRLQEIGPSVTGDGDPDLVFIGAGEVLILGDPTASLEPGQAPTARVALPDTGLVPQTAFLGNVNDDGVADLVVVLRDVSGALIPTVAHVFAGPLEGAVGPGAIAARVEVSDSLFERVTASAAGDLNVDGLLDLVVSDEQRAAGRGRVSVLYGPLTGERDLADAEVVVDGEHGACEFGLNEADHVGKTLLVGDGDGDGIDDLWMAMEPLNDPDRGCTYRGHRSTVGVLRGGRG